MRSDFDFAAYAERVLEKKQKEDAFAERIAAYCAISRMIAAALGEALATGDAELVAEIRKERERFDRDHLESLVTQAKELS